MPNFLSAFLLTVCVIALIGGLFGFVMYTVILPARMPKVAHACESFFAKEAVTSIAISICGIFGSLLLLPYTRLDEWIITPYSTIILPETVAGMVGAFVVVVIAAFLFEKV